MKNKDVIELTKGLFEKGWAYSFKKGCPVIEPELSFDDGELLEYFKMWQCNPSASKEEILSRAKDGVPLKIYREQCACIYFLLDKSEIVYVGKTINMASRLYTHLNQRMKNFDAISLIDVGHPSQLTPHEWPYIAKFMPKYNFPKKTPDIIAKMHQLLWVDKIDMVSMINERISNTKQTK